LSSKDSRPGELPLFPPPFEKAVFDSKEIQYLPHRVINYVINRSRLSIEPRKGREDNTSHEGYLLHILYVREGKGSFSEYKNQAASLL
jgi:hypothetical protein